MVLQIEISESNISVCQYIQHTIFQSIPSYFPGCKPPTGTDKSGVWHNLLCTCISVQFNGLTFILGNANLFLCLLNNLRHMSALSVGSYHLQHVVEFVVNFKV